MTIEELFEKSGKEYLAFDIGKGTEMLNVEQLKKRLGESIPIEPPVMQKIADGIAEELFINGAGEKAKRLVLELEDRSNGGGWGKKPVVDVILKHLKSNFTV